MILLLAGTGEARDLARAMHKAGVPGIASLAGVVSDRAALALPTRTGGFGGDAGFIRYLTKTPLTGVIDATHPFAASITNRTARICAERGLPYLRFDRPAWAPEPTDRWTEAADPEALTGVIPVKARVFLAVGRKESTRYQGLEHSTVILRSIEPVPDLPPNWISIEARGPFSVQEECALFQTHRIDWLVTKNSGGASAAKLLAARHMGLPVAMIQRPALPQGIEIVQDIEPALIWAATHAGTSA